MAKRTPKPLRHLPAPAAPGELTVAQLNAVDLLAVGKNDSQTAELLGIHRVSVTRWRRYSPEFRAALAEQRAAVWSVAADRLRALLPKAIDTLADALEHSEDKLTVALAVLKLAGPLPVVPTEPTEAEEYIRQQVSTEREQMREEDALGDAIAGLPKRKDHEEAVREKLNALAGIREVSEPSLTDDCER